MQFNASKIFPYKILVITPLFMFGSIGSKILTIRVLGFDVIYRICPLSTMIISAGCPVVGFVGVPDGVP